MSVVAGQYIALHGDVAAFRGRAESEGFAVSEDQATPGSIIIQGPDNYK